MWRTDTQDTLKRIALRIHNLGLRYVLCEQLVCGDKFRRVSVRSYKWLATLRE